MNPEDTDQPTWLRRSVSRVLSSAQSRAEERARRFLAAAFELIDAKDTTEFTLQEVVDQAKLTLRSFYQYFDSKDELLFAMFEETVRESVEDLRRVVEAESEPIERLRVFIIRLHEWCQRVEKSEIGAHNRGAISELGVQLAIKNSERAGAVMVPLSRMLSELLEDAVAAGAIRKLDARRATLLLQQTVMYGWLVNRVAPHQEMRVTADETWEFCRFALSD